MNRQGKGKIEWTDWSWNPIKGMCPVGCSYCYARAMYKNPRYGWDSSIRLDADELVRPMLKSKPIKIFVCSTFEIFHPAADEDRNMIFHVIKACPHHIFQVLTKMPENIDRPMPDNVWLGVSVSKGNTEGWNNLGHLADATARVKFISFEPLLGRLNAPMVINASQFDWFIFGRLTGHGKKHDPELSQIQYPIDYLCLKGKPVFLKHNLKDIWPGKLVQEWPE